MKDMERIMHSEHLRPKDVPVKLASGGVATVAVFPLEQMIIQLLTDENIMKPENIADGYNYLTGKATKPVSHYSEVHTGDAWDPACCHHCGDNPKHFPLALILYRDKSHYDSNGVLSFTPFSFTLTLFNQRARKRVKFWKPWFFVPNLTYGAR